MTSVIKDVPISEFVCCIVYLAVKNYFNFFQSINNLTNELPQKICISKVIEMIVIFYGYIFMKTHSWNKT